MPPDLTMIVPTYNERDRLRELTGALFAAAQAARLQLELVIVDDNSPDGTGAIADELAQVHPITVVHRAGKLGLGTAVVAGFGVASAETLGVMDADLSHPPALVPHMLHVFRATRADLLVASRYVPGGSTLNWPLGRRLLSRAGCLLARPLSPIRDAASGFFLIRRAIASPVTIQAGGFKIGLELIVRGAPSRLVEIPYQFHDRQVGESKMSRTEALGYLVQLKDLYRFAWSRPRPRPVYRQVTAGEVEAIVREAGVGADLEAAGPGAGA
jgi:dolichol-phosphate mannosyltransferase